MVAAHRRQAELDQAVGREGGLEGAGQAVAQVDDKVGRVPPQIQDDRLERLEVPMDVGHHGNAHGQLAELPENTRAKIVSTCLKW